MMQHDLKKHQIHQTHQLVIDVKAFFSNVKSETSASVWFVQV